LGGGAEGDESLHLAGRRVVNFAAAVAGRLLEFAGDEHRDIEHGCESGSGGADGHDGDLSRKAGLFARNVAVMMTAGAAKIIGPSYADSPEKSSTEPRPCLASYAADSSRRRFANRPRARSRRSSRR